MLDRKGTNLLVDQDGDYRDIFITRKTFLTGALGLIYRVPVTEPDGWSSYEFPKDDQHVGIQSHVGFVALYSHPGRSSATLRGKAVREVLMCQKVPDPPSNVDFTLVSDSTNPIYKTARARLGAHATEATCAGCHRIMDPIGLTLENFDGAGQWRMTENGVAIDTSGEVDGAKYADAAGLGVALHNNPAVTECLVNRMYAYATGHIPRSDEKPILRYFGEAFADDGFRIMKLLRRLALSDAFYMVTPPDAREPKQITEAASQSGKS